MKSFHRFTDDEFPTLGKWMPVSEGDGTEGFCVCKEGWHREDCSERTKGIAENQGCNSIVKNLA